MQPLYQIKTLWGLFPCTVSYIDAHVMCKMGGEEGELTLLGSDYFIQNYRLNYAQKVEPEDGHHTGDQIVPKEEEGVVVLPTAEPELDTPEGTARKKSYLPR